MVNILNNPKSLYAEAIRTIKTNIKYSSADRNKKIILVTSSEAGEGKSTIAANLALSLSQDGKRVILIDGDLRRPSVHKKFRISALEGLTEVLIGEKDLEKAKVKIDNNLDVIPLGHIPPNPAELLASDKMEQILSTLREEYDYIIIDTNPLGIVADSQILSSKVDGVVLVAKYESTKKDNLITCKKLIDQVGGKIIGVVINRVKVKGNKYYYYYN